MHSTSKSRIVQVVSQDSFYLNNHAVCFIFTICPLYQAKKYSELHINDIVNVRITFRENKNNVIIRQPTILRKKNAL